MKYQTHSALTFGYVRAAKLVASDVELQTKPEPPPVQPPELSPFVVVDHDERFVFDRDVTGAGEVISSTAELTELVTLKSTALMVYEPVPESRGSSVTDNVAM